MRGSPWSGPRPAARPPSVAEGAGRPAAVRPRGPPPPALRPRGRTAAESPKTGGPASARMDVSPSPLRFPPDAHTLHINCMRSISALYGDDAMDYSGLE